MRNAILAVGLGGLLLAAGFVAGSLMRPEPARYALTDCEVVMTPANQASFTKTIPGQGKKGIGVRCVRLDRQTGRMILVASSKAKWYAPPGLDVAALETDLRAYKQTHCTAAEKDTAKNIFDRCYVGK